MHVTHTCDCVSHMKPAHMHAQHGTEVVCSSDRPCLGAAGIAAWTCHQPGSTFDVVPGDLVSSTILAAAAAVTAQVCFLQYPWLTACNLIVSPKSLTPLLCIVCQTRRHKDDHKHAEPGKQFYPVASSRLFNWL